MTMKIFSLKQIRFFFLFSLFFRLPIIINMILPLLYSIGTSTIMEVESQDIPVNITMTINSFWHRRRMRRVFAKTKVKLEKYSLDDLYTSSTWNPNVTCLILSFFDFFLNHKNYLLPRISNFWSNYIYLTTTCWRVRG
jgi:hypothetical protein